MKFFDRKREKQSVITMRISEREKKNIQRTAKGLRLTMSGYLLSLHRFFGALDEDDNRRKTFLADVKEF